MMKTSRFFSFFLVAFISIQAFSQVILPSFFGDNMVLQQKTSAPVWGKAKPNGVIKVITSWDKKEYITKTNADGRWKIALTTPSAGGPYTITIKDDRKLLTLKNIMIGEVWLCSGQSNMEMPLAGWGKIYNYEREIAEANYPNIRIFQAKHTTTSYPMDDIESTNNGWQECSPATIPNFSATAYFFGRDLYKSQNVSIGLIHTSWGGTLAEAWTSEQSLREMPEFLEDIEDIKKDPVQIDQNEWMKQVQENDFGLKNNVALAAQKNYNDYDWKTATLPGVWEENGLSNVDGIVWYRKTIDIPDNWTGNDLTLSLGSIDDGDITYFNGVQIGTTNGWDMERKYLIPAKLVKKGTAVIAVRVLDTGGGGGFHGSPLNMYISPVNKETLRENLDGEWKYKLSVSQRNQNPNLENRPTGLYNGMIAPFVSYAIKGVIWYQGEGNSGRSYQYRTLFPLMINDWRTKWGYDFPFYFVQLANFMQVKEEPSESGWAELREAQFQTLRLENTGMATIIDIGDADDIHPKNKQDVGLRLSLQARKNTYGEDIIASGPLYDSYRMEGDKIRIFFKPGTGKLTVKNDDILKGFSIAGPDKKFYWADAKIEGNEVIVSSSSVAFPVAVRYAWADNPICNLYNEAGLPASPFRTDDWLGVTAK